METARRELGTAAVVGAELARARDTIEHLEVALRTSRRIGMAMGILMATDKLREDEAFERLSSASQRANRKLREIADDVIMTGALSDSAEQTQLRRRSAGCSSSLLRSV